MLHYRSLLHAYVQYNTDDLKDLLSHLTRIHLTTAKQDAFNKEIATKHIDALHDHHIRNTFYNLFSICDILPDDVTQYILSFNFYPTVSSVCKLFHTLADRNHSMEMKERNLAVMNDTFSFDPLFTKTRIITCDMVQNASYFLQNIINECNSGDTIAIYDGTYTFTTIDRTYDIAMDCAKDIQIIGIGKDVIFKDNTNVLTFMNIDGGIDDASACSVHIENIQFNCNHSVDRYCTFNVSDNAQLSMMNCKVKLSNCGIIAAQNATLNIRSCEFTGGASAIEISSVSTIANIVGCKFTNHGQRTTYYKQSESGCICIPHTYAHISIDGLDDMRESDAKEMDIELKCIGNIFENNLCYPITKCAEFGADDRDEFIVKAEKYILKHNVLRGYNRVPERKNMDIQTANKMYYNEQAVQVYL
eukprot:204533_1